MRSIRNSHLVLASSSCCSHWSQLIEQSFPFQDHGHSPYSNACRNCCWPWNCDIDLYHLHLYWERISVSFVVCWVLRHFLISIRTDVWSLPERRNCSIGSIMDGWICTSIESTKPGISFIWLWAVDGWPSWCVTCWDDCCACSGTIAFCWRSCDWLSRADEACVCSYTGL